jgi:pantothenate synthetase
VQFLSHADFARLHPTGDHPERGERIAVLQQGFDWTEVRPADRGDIERCHTGELVELIASIDRPTMVLLAVHVGSTRLIDNCRLEPARESATTGAI